MTPSSFEKHDHQKTPMANTHRLRNTSHHTMQRMMIRQFVNQLSVALPFGKLSARSDVYITQARDSSGE